MVDNIFQWDNKVMQDIIIGLKTSGAMLSSEELEKEARASYLEMQIPIVIVDEKGVAKDPHPMGARPVKPNKHDFKSDASGQQKFLDASEKYIADHEKWVEIDSTLEIYGIDSMVTDAGQTISGNVLHWTIGKKYKAIVFKDKTVQVV